MVTGTEGLFGHIDEFPSDQARHRFQALVGLDRITQQLVAEARVLLDPSTLERWSTKHHGQVIPAVAEVTERTSLVVLAGDVGTGKTELAETIGDQIAREMNVPITLLPLSLTARGHGAVGEMTTLITRAFEKAHEAAAGGRGRGGKIRHGVILLIDEADAIAQSRELSQMHHEDRAGVNALIRGIDGLRHDRLPVLTIMCTNRADAIDPAVSRRAAAIYEFIRPNDEQRHRLLSRSFAGVMISPADMALLVQLTGPTGDRDYGTTYSDLRQRFVPTVVLDALDRPDHCRPPPRTRPTVPANPPLHRCNRAMTDNTRTFNLGEAFFLRQEQLRNDLNLGDIATHPGTKGDDTELNWLGMVDKLLPNRYGVAKAFVVDVHGGLSQQIDIVIHDRHFSPLLFDVGGALYIPAESVYAAVEVKQTLDKTHID